MLFIILQALEEGSSESAGMGEAFKATAGHLTDSHASFMRHWLRLVELEEGCLPDRRSEIWALSGQQAVLSPPFLHAQSLKDSARLTGAPSSGHYQVSKRCSAFHFCTLSL